MGEALKSLYAPPAAYLFCALLLYGSPGEGDRAYILYLFSPGFVFWFFANLHFARREKILISRLIRRAEILPRVPDEIPGESRDALRIAFEKLDEALLFHGKEHTRRLLESEIFFSLLRVFRDGVFCITPRGTLRYRGGEISPLLLGEDGVGRNVHSMVRNPSLLNFIRRALSGELEEKEFSGAYAFDAGETRYALYYFPIGREGEDRIAPDLHVFVARDVTAEHNLEKSRLEFLQNAGHELKTPITAVRGYAETIALNAELPERQKQFLHSIMRNAERLDNIVADMLTLAGTGSEEYPFVPIWNSRENLEGRLRALLGGTLHGKEQTLEFYADDPEAGVFADERLLDRALENLVGNASRYSPPGASIRVELRADPGAVQDAIQNAGPDAIQGAEIRGKDSGAILVVSDEGPGIPEEFREKIFERFFRLDRDRSRKKGGTGLGLAIVRDIALRHGGWIRVDSSASGGAKFVLCFPGGQPNRPVI